MDCCVPESPLHLAHGSLFPVNLTAAPASPQVGLVSKIIPVANQSARHKAISANFHSPHVKSNIILSSSNLYTFR